MRTTRRPAGFTAREFLEKVRTGKLTGIVETSEGTVLRIEHDETADGTGQAITLEVIQYPRPVPALGPQRGSMRGARASVLAPLFMLGCASLESA